MNARANNGSLEGGSYREPFSGPSAPARLPFAPWSSLIFTSHLPASFCSWNHQDVGCCWGLFSLLHHYIQNAVAVGGLTVSAILIIAAVEKFFNLRCSRGRKRMRCSEDLRGIGFVSLLTSYPGSFEEDYLRFKHLVCLFLFMLKPNQ